MDEFLNNYKSGTMNGSEVPGILNAAKDWWAIAVLAMLGWFALVWKYGQEFFRPLFRSLFRNRTSTIDILFQRIRALEREHGECQVGLRTAQREAYEAKVRVATVETEMKAIREENSELANSIKSLENLLILLTQGKK